MPRTITSPLVLAGGLALVLFAAAANAASLVPITGVTAVSGSYFHYCGVTTAGGVKCWASNNFSELGENTVAARFVPVEPTGLSSGIASVASGLNHTCAVTTGGGVKCWGRNQSGQVGDGTTTLRGTPVDVPALTSDVTAIAAGGAHTCALMSGGTVKCWGSNSSGQLGNGTTTSSSVPIDVPGLSGVTAITTGESHSCALASGGAKCWGFNSDGELGDGTTVNKTSPTDVTGLTSGVASLVAGRFHTCAITTGGGAKCWGFATFGQLGNNSQAQPNVPVDVVGLATGVTSITPGATHTCAVVTGGNVKCWGYNTYSELGDGTTTQSLVPVDVAGLTGVTAVAWGAHSTCARTTGGGVKCWGSIGYGDLGNGVETRMTLPTDVAGLTSGVAKLATGDDMTCAVTTGGAAKCWGRNDRGGLGDSSNTHRATPSNVTGFANTAAAVAPGTLHGCAIDTSGGAWCWGRNNVGQLGNGTQQGGIGTWAPTPVSGLATGVAALAVGFDHSCALTTGGGVKCWGNNGTGQLGNGTTTLSSVPVDVTGLTSGVAAIASGGAFTCAVTTGGGAKCWGWNGDGQLGDGTQVQKTTPTDVTGLTSGVVSITTSMLAHACARTTGGGVKCWGLNDDGQLGDNSVTRRLTPVDVVGMTSGVAAVSAGVEHTCALTTGGGMKCWGNGGSNRLGDGTNVTRRTPVDVVGHTSGVAAIGAGGSHTCALNTGGGLKCWGNNAAGQAGTGAAIMRAAVGDVLVLDTSVAATISTSKSHSLALDSTGKVYAWGSDSHGQLGQGRAINRVSPAQVTGLPSATHVSLAQHALAVDIYKQVWSWGENGCGQLGPRDAIVATKPARTIGATGMKRVAAGGCFSLALKEDGTVWAWGTLPGDASGTGLRQVAGLAGITEIAAGSGHALALRNDGVVFALGDNAQGQLGRGSTGAAQAAAQVPGLSGVTAIAAGDTSSMALVGGQPYFWGRHADATLVTSPLSLNGLGGAAVSITVTGNRPYAARADGAALAYNAATPAWVTDISATNSLAGFTGIAKVTSGNLGFLVGINGAGQVFAGGANTAGQLGRGNTTASSSVAAVTGLGTTTMVAAGALYPSVLALQADGTLWFWGADTLGESGDGGQVTSSVPLAVSIPATIRQVATGDRFSVAVDTNGDTWLWGDNAGAAVGNTFVNRSAPARGAARNVQAIAAGGPGLVVYLLTDGTVRKGGAQANVGSNVDPIVIPGLANIVDVAAGEDTGYALRGDGVLFAFGGGASGELGNGTTAFSMNAVQVQGIAGAVVKISAAKSRAGAVTSDGKAWAWGAAPLGNGSPGSSATAVQVPGISDAASISVGSSAALVRRTGGGVIAWGDLGLADVGSQNVLSPYAVAFHEPAKSLAVGNGSSLGFIVGNTGLAWGFGNYPTISTAASSIGDGTYVRRPRPVVLLAAGGSGNIDTNNWYFDLEPASPESVPAASTPRMLGVSQLYGSDAGIAFNATVKYKSTDLGKSVNNYVFGLVPPAFFSQVKSVNLSSKSALAAKAAKNGGFVLAQLTPSGWSDVTGQLIAYSQGTANAAGGATNILNGVTASNLQGARFCIGYGESAGSMLSFNALREVLLLPGASQNTSGVPCVLTGVYVDGPAGSRVSSPVTFKASVVGLSPSGSAQFKDGAQALSGSLNLSTENDAVASVQVATSTLAVGEHSIGAAYFGDGQNAATSAEIPLLHTVTAALTQATLAGAASSDERTPVPFRATVIGLNPTGSVQFKDGAANLGDPVPLVGGQATLRTETLALGDHSITAVYSGDGNNVTTTSNVVAHKVVPVFRTRVEVTSSAADPLVGQSITLTATVTGNNPTGTVTFRDGATDLGTVAVVNGVATLTISTLGSGAHSITASYSGDGDDDAVSSPTFTQHVAVPALFSMNPATLAFGGQLRSTTSAVRTVVITNAGGAPLTVTSVAASTHFSQANNCTSVAGGASCTISVRFAPVVEGALNGSINIQTSLGPHVLALTGTGAASLVSHYYTSILRRAPDAGGQAFWDSEAVRVAGLGVNVNEVWFAMAQAFYFSAEYAAQNRDNTGFITDLYNTFFQRAPDAGGLAFWVGNLDQGMPREVALAQFMFSAEFVSFAQARYGNTAARAEVDAVVDFYRGLLGRLPDDGGFANWVGRFRTAQCAGQAAILAEVEAISSAFALSGEYAARNRTPAQYVGDLYNAFLRRGGDLAGVQYWIGQVATGARTREQVRIEFKNSPEFQARVQALIAQGCLP